MIRYLLYRFIPYYFILLLIIGGFLLISSETGLRIIWSQLSDRLPQGIKIEQVHGELLGRIHVQGLHVEQPGLDLQVREAWFKWSPRALWQGTIQVDELAVMGTRIAITPVEKAVEDTSSEPPGELPQLPKIVLKRLQVNELELVNDGQSGFLLNRARLNGTYKNQRLDLHLQEFDSREFGQLVAELDGDLQPNRIELRRFKLSTAEPYAGELTLSGDCQWPSMQCLAASNWRNLQWPLNQPGQWFSPTGQAEVIWQTDQRQVTLATQASGDQLPISDITAKLEFDFDQQIWDLAADWQPVEAADTQLKITANFDPENTRFTAQARPSNIDLATWMDGWPSTLGGLVEIEGQLQPALQVSAKSLSIDGSIREQAFALKSRGSYQPEKWNVESLDMRWADNTLRGNLSHRSTWNGKIQISANDLEALDSNLAGKGQVTATISGKKQWPNVNWQGNLAGLKWRDTQLAALQTSGNVSQDQLLLNTELRNLETASLSLEKLQLTSKGSPASAVSQLTMQESRLDANLEIRTQWKEKAKELKAVIANAQIQTLLGSESHSWELSEGGSLRWANGDLQLERQCWTSDDTALCAEFQKAAETIQGLLTLADYPLGRLKSQLPIGSSLVGSANAQLTIQPSSLDAPIVNLNVQTSAATVNRKLGDEDFELLKLDPGSLQANLQGQQLDAGWSFPLSNNNPQSGIQGQAQVNAEREIDLVLGLNFDDLGVIAAFSPEILKASGPIAGDIKLTGALAEPKLEADIDLGPAEISLDQPNIELKDLRIRLATQADKSIQINGGFQSGEGQASVSGQISDWQRDPALKATLSGQNVLVMDTPEARVVVSPDIQLQARLPDIKLRGAVHVDSADIAPHDFSQSGAITPVEDQVIVGQEKLAERGLRIDSELSLTLGDAVKVKAMGLSSGIQGKLTTRLKPGKVTTAVGKLRLVDGRYKAYGQDLRIEKGELLFSGGPVTEPGLDLKAYRQARVDVRAGVIVRGSIRNPRVSLYSDPDMRETDQLSYLVLGRAAEAQNDEDQAALNNAALALGLKGSDLLAKQFKSQLGLDEVSIGTQPGQSSDQASLVLGKYLSPDIYVSYGVGLFEPVYTFKLRYQLSRRWTLQTESGLESGGDLYYTIER